ncbi:MAG: hypothetical protein IJ025_07405 [Clostridia bacterium]|nr:hypothetical protein [Clostridia bacterium]
MKKIALVLSVVLVLSLFSACGNNETDQETTTEVTETEVQNVVISVNKDIVADETSFLTFVSEFEGLTSTVDEKFYTLTMPQETYADLLKAKAQEVYDAYDNLIAQGGFIKDVEYGADFRTVTVSVDREGFDALDAGTKQLQLITIGAYAMSYQMFLTEGQSTLVIAEYADSAEEAMRLSLPIKM